MAEPFSAVGRSLGILLGRVLPSISHIFSLVCSASDEGKAYGYRSIYDHIYFNSRKIFPSLASPCNSFRDYELRIAFSDVTLLSALNT